MKDNYVYKFGSENSAEDGVGRLCILFFAIFILKRIVYIDLWIATNNHCVQFLTSGTFSFPYLFKICRSCLYISFVKYLLNIISNKDNAFCIALNVRIWNICIYITFSVTSSQLIVCWLWTGSIDHLWRFEVDFNGNFGVFIVELRLCFYGLNYFIVHYVLVYNIRGARFIYRKLNITIHLIAEYYLSFGTECFKDFKYFNN